MDELKSTIRQELARRQSQAVMQTLLQRILINDQQNRCPFCLWEPESSVVQINSDPNTLVLKGLCAIHATDKQKTAMIHRLNEILETMEEIRLAAIGIDDLPRNASLECGFEHTPEVIQNLNETQSLQWQKAFMKQFGPAWLALNEALKKLHAKRVVEVNEGQQSKDKPSE